MNKTRRSAALVLAITLLFSPITAVRVQAQWVDIVQSAKEMGLDTLAWIVINKTMERMTASTVNWINTGFKGKPAYLTDPAAYYQNLGDQIAGQYILSDPNLNFLCGPISAKVRIALQKSYVREQQWNCTLTEVGKNLENFMDNFDNGGWDSFFELTQRQQNNPIGAYMQAEADLNSRLAQALDLKKDDLNWGGGIMSYKRCRPGTEKAAPDANGLGACESEYNACVKWANGDPATAQAEGAKCSEKLRACNGKYANVDVGDCLESDKEAVTPGSAIQGQLTKALGAGSDKLAAADEINEIVSALLNQLVNQALGKVGGLLGATKGNDATDKKNPITEKLNTSDQLTGYFCFDDPNNPTSEYYDTDPSVCKYPDTPKLDFPIEPPDIRDTLPPGTVITIPSGSSGDSSE